jgi:NADPH-dependent 7-cyano-7-deazaguanine reductase QueF-like protein
MNVYLILNGDSASGVFNIKKLKSKIDFSPRFNNIKPLGDTVSYINFELSIDTWSLLEKTFMDKKGFINKIQNISVVINSKELIHVRFYGCQLNEFNFLEESVDLTLVSDYHESAIDVDDELKSLFMAMERDEKLKQIGIV